MNIRILDIINRSVVWKDSITEVLSELKKYTGFDAVAIRLHEGEDFPYYAHNGFSPSFVEAERYLCSRDDSGEIERDANGNPYVECMCGNVICGRIDASKYFFTEHGSFWSNNTSKLLADTTDEDRQTRTRNRCNSEGYESVALIPLKDGRKIVGLIQLNDRTAGQFTEELISFFEDLGQSIGIAFSHKEIERELSESEERFRTLFTESQEAMALLVDGIHVDCNDACLELFKATRDQFIGKSPTFISPEHQPDGTLSAQKAQDMIHEAFDTGSSRFEWLHQRLDGSEFWVETVATVMNIGGKKGLYAMCRDITDRKQVHEELEQHRKHLEELVDERTKQLVLSERMAATGRLAASVAHEINSPLQGMMSHLDLMKDGLPKGSPKIGNYNHVRTSIIRIRDIVSQLLNVHLCSKKDKSSLDVNDLISRVVSLLYNQFQIHEVSVNSILQERLPKISGWPHQLHQVFLNLLLNALDSIGTNGEIVITTSFDDCSLTMVFSDNGDGIDPEILDHIFDPFTSTKTDSGVGLGLFVCQGLIENHNGKITAENNKGEGSTFTITLPRSCSHEGESSCRR